MTCSPPERPDPEKSRVKTVMFEGSNIMAASLPSALHPLNDRIAVPLRNAKKTLRGPTVNQKGKRATGSKKLTG